MVIEVLKNKYKCGCNRGTADLKKAGILDKLNAIIEWDISRFPKKQVIESDKDEWNKYFGPGCEKLEYEEVQDENGVKCRTFECREFLGYTPELKPGNCFLYDGQVIAVDSEDRLILITGASGRGALKRILEEDIDPEFNLQYGDVTEIDDLSYKGLDKKPDLTSEFDIEVRIPYAEYNKWKTYFLDGNDKIPVLEDNKHAVLCEVSPSEYPITFNLVMTDYCAYFKSEELDEDDIDIARSVLRGVISWFYKHTSRSINPLEIEDKKQKSIADYQQKKQLEEIMKGFGM